MVKPVSSGFSASVKSQNLTWDNIISEQQDHPMHRTNEFFVSRAPAHAFGDGETGQGFFYQFWYQCAGCMAFFGVSVNQP